MKWNAYGYKAAALAVALAAGLSTPVYADDGSMDMGYGDSSREANAGQNFPFNPIIDKRPPTLFAADLSDLTPNGQCGALADEDPFWQPVRRNPAVERAGTAAAEE